MDPRRDLEASLDPRRDSEACLAPRRDVEASLDPRRDSEACLDPRREEGGVFGSVGCTEVTSINAKIKFINNLHKQFVRYVYPTWIN